jgi:hypothetical protein
VGKEEERGKRTEIHSTSSNVRSKHDTANSVLERLGSRIPLTLTLARVNLVEIDALVPEAGRALEKVGDKAGSPRRREEDHDLERRTVLRKLGAKDGESLREEVEEGGNGDGELLNVLVGVLLTLVDAADELVRGEEGEVRDLVNGGRNSGGEEKSLARVLLTIGEVRDDLLDFATEPGFEETVRLVQNEGTETGELGTEGGVLEVVEETTGSRDENVCKGKQISSASLGEDGKEQKFSICWRKQ